MATNPPKYQAAYLRGYRAGMRKNPTVRKAYLDAKAAWKRGYAAGKRDASK